MRFQSTLPTRGSDICRWGDCTAANISIHAPHEGERLDDDDEDEEDEEISIHAPHEGERRELRRLKEIYSVPISIHAPHEGERQAVLMLMLIP